MATTFTVDVVAGLLAILDAFKVTNPALLRHTFPAQPSHFNTDLPCGFVGPRPEIGLHDSQTRTRTMSPSLTIVDRITNNAETMGRMDIVQDKFADHLTASPHVVSGTIWSRWTVTPGQIDVGDGTALQSLTWTLDDLSIQEGRV